MVSLVAWAADPLGTPGVDVINVTGYTGTHTLTFRAVCTDSRLVLPQRYI